MIGHWEIGHCSHIIYKHVRSSDSGTTQCVMRLEHVCSSDSGTYIVLHSVL